MLFILRMVVRETRASWRRLLFFFLCVALGVGAMAAVRSVIQNVRGALAREARALTAADLIIQSNRAWDDETQATIAKHLAAAGGTVGPTSGSAPGSAPGSSAGSRPASPAGSPTAPTATTDVVELATMVRPADAGKAVAKMVELQAVEAAYPFYGRVIVQSGEPYQHAMLQGGGVLARPELLAQLGVQVGDPVIIGQATFTIRGVLTGEPGRRMGLFTLGPRVLMDAADLPRTGLVGFGSRVRYQRLVRVSDPTRLERLTRDLREAFRTSLVTVRSYRNTEDRVGEQLQTAENYLGLVGYVMVVLGGIGVWSVTRVFIQQKLQSIAVLKCVGASVRQVLGVYVAQVMLLGTLGSLCGLVLGGLMLWAVPATVTGGGTLAALGSVELGLTPAASVQAFGIGVLVSLLFALVPLLEVRRVRPLLLLRENATASRGLDLLQVIAGALVIAVLVLLASWQAASWKVGLIVSAGFVATAIALHLVGLGLVRLVRPLGRATWFPLRHAANGLGRPGHQTRVILLAVGLGVFFILGVRLLQTNLIREFSVALQPDAADLFLIDVQKDQEQPMRQFLASVGSDLSPRMLPVLRARVTGVRGKELNLASVESVRERSSISREFTVTYRDHLQPNERLLDGQFWSAGSAGASGAAGVAGAPGATTMGEPEVSVERLMRDRVGMRVGDHVRFDILGRSIEARVSSIREVDWSDSRNGGFVFVFRPDVLAQAPHMYVAMLKGPADPIVRARFQRDLVARFPNVSVIDARDVLRTLEGVLGNVTLGISIVGGVALLSGLLILVGAVAMTKFQRLREVALLKTLGASSRVIAALLVIEYGLLGTVAGAVGAVGGSILSWVVSTRVLEIAWRLEPLTLIAAVALTAGAVGAVGVVASVDVLRRKPLAVLRAG